MSKISTFYAITPSGYREMVEAQNIHYAADQFEAKGYEVLDWSAA